MKTLFQVLEDTKLMQGQMPDGIAHNMQVPGSIREDGKVNGNSQNAQETQINKTSSKQQSGECYGQKIPISEDSEGKKKLTLLIKSCYDSLNTYGRTIEQLEATTMLMHMVLGRFDYDTVRKAFSIYLQSHSDMPKPADIVQIIEPKPQPRKWCATTFIDIKRRSRENQFITNAEKEYCESFINARITEPDNAPLIDDALKMVEQQNKQYWLEG